MSQYKIHVHQEFHDDDLVPYITVYREDLETGKRDCLRSGYCNWPEAIVKTCVQIGVQAALYCGTKEIPDGEW